MYFVYKGATNNCDMSKVIKQQLLIIILSTQVTPISLSSHLIIKLLYLSTQSLNYINHRYVFIGSTLPEIVTKKLKNTEDSGAGRKTRQCLHSSITLLETGDDTQADRGGHRNFLPEPFIDVSCSNLLTVTELLTCILTQPPTF